jgi:hypothetical protein
MRRTGRRALARLVAAVVGSALVLAPSAAWADDEIEIDERLASLGYEAAYTSYLEGDGGVRVSLDYASFSTDRADYEEEAREAAEVVWDHLEVTVLAVDVAPSYGVSWLDGGLPAAVSLSRTDLEQAFGPRAPELDTGGSMWVDDEFFGFVLLGASGLALVGTLAAGGVGGYLLGRRRRPQPEFAAGTWSGPAAGGTLGGSAAPGSWGAPAGPGWGAPAAPGSWGAPSDAPGSWPSAGSVAAPPRPGPGADSSPDANTPWRTP